MEYNFKYTRNQIHILNGIIWSTVTLINIGLLVFISVTMLSSFVAIMVPILLINIVFSTPLAIFYIKIETRDYIRINSTQISIDTGLVRKRKEIGFDNIDSIKEIGTTLRVGLKEGKDIRVNLELLALLDIKKLYSILDNEINN